MKRHEPRGTGRNIAPGPADLGACLPRLRHALAFPRLRHALVPRASGMRLPFRASGTRRTPNLAFDPAVPIARLILSIPPKFTVFPAKD